MVGTVAAYLLVMPLSKDKVVVLRMTRLSALRAGLLFCTCGHPENNHFSFNNNPCAHCDCRSYTEHARRDMELIASDPAVADMNNDELQAAFEMQERKITELISEIERRKRSL